jgi:hypothetical protein
MARPARFIERIIFRRIVGTAGRLVSLALYLAHFLHGAFCLVRFFRLTTPVLLLFASIAYAGGHDYASPDDWRRKQIPDAEIAADPRLVIYDRSEMPQAYQMQNSAGDNGFHWSLYNVSGDPPDNSLPNGKGGNAGIDFPWRVTGGTDECGDVVSFAWMLLPEGKPVVWWREHMDDRLGGGKGYRWLFPVGTRFGEVLLMPCNGSLVTCEMRVRERVKNDWAVDLLRPFPEAADLAEAIRTRRPDWGHDRALAEAVRHLEAELPLKPTTLTDTKHPRRAVRLEASEDVLPPIDDALVYELMSTTPFRSALGLTWRGTDCYAPANVVMPSGYRGTFIGNDQTSCAQCHKTASVAARVFDQPRGWYGHVPGNDEVFSWYPVDPRSVSRNGMYIAPTIRNRPGFIERYDVSRHPAADYHAIKRDGK